MLLRANKRLRHLGLDGSVEKFMAFVSKRYFIEIFALLPELVVVESDFVQVGLQEVLTALPALN
jgi:hypothetical protein